jgi:hypothetical protein
MNFRMDFVQNKNLTVDEYSDRLWKKIHSGWMFGWMIDDSKDEKMKMNALVLGIFCKTCEGQFCCIFLICWKKEVLNHCH